MRAALVVGVIAAATAAACATQRPAASPGEAIHRSKCGACHPPPEPGRLDRPKLETVLGRHRKRVPMDEDRWAEVTTFMASSR